MDTQGTTWSEGKGQMNAAKLGVETGEALRGY